jgi:DNA ligase (NAD+)
VSEAKQPKPPKPGPESIVYTKEYYEGLKALLIECNKEYHTEGTPRYSDADFDALLRMLVRIETKYPEWLKPDSPSQTVGATPPK